MSRHRCRALARRARWAPGLGRTGPSGLCPLVSLSAPGSARAPHKRTCAQGPLPRPPPMHLGVSALLRWSFRPAHPPCASARGSQLAVGLRVGVSLPGPLAPYSSSGFKLRLSEHRPARGLSRSPPLLPPLQAPQAGGGGQASRHAAERPRGPPGQHPDRAGLAAPAVEATPPRPRVLDELPTC